MSPPDLDLVEMVECMYRSDGTDSDWLLRVARSVQPLLDPEGLGVIGNFYDCPDPCSYAPGKVFALDAPAPLSRRYLDYIEAPHPGFIADTVLTRSSWLISKLPTWSNVRGHFEKARMADKVTINAVEADGRGVCIGSFVTNHAGAAARDPGLLSRIGSHLTASHRLRRRFGGAPVNVGPRDAVFDPDGRLRHAGKAIRSRADIEPLRQAARSLERARARSRGADSRARMFAWDPIVAGRFTLIDYFERDGRRFVLAAENLPQEPCVDLLSPRERDVVRHAHMGHHNKAIAYDLGLAESTIRVLVARACAKVGARSRRELLEKTTTLRPDPGSLR
jgi:DNA-binding CsgD family transcriptional regulator